MFSLYPDLARQRTALLLEEAETERLARQARTVRRRRRTVRRPPRTASPSPRSLAREH
jgi:hypothetical protein